MKQLLTTVACFMAVMISCQTADRTDCAVAVWDFQAMDDGTKENSRLDTFGDVQFLALGGDEAKASKARGGDGKAAYFKGGWLDAGQGVNGELNLTGKNITVLVRARPENITGYAPLAGKAGNDQNVAYTVAYDKINNDIYIRTLMGSDDIGGAHRLQYKLPAEEADGWHDILLRFNGKVSELYVNGILRDDEVTVGEVRDWNRRPFLIGAQYKKPYGYAPATPDQVEAAFSGWIDHVAVWNRCLTDEEVCRWSGVKALQDGKPAYYTEYYRPQFHFSAQKNWLNDPNGLVYYKGTYHLFFQYMPPHRPGAYKDWGHAVSTDLVHWEQTQEHITPHKVWSGCWSGSAVVDVNNTAGFQTGEEKAIVAFITNGGNPADGIGPMCTQCIAYSNDGGMTFTYYDQNPVIRNINGANRDPKVVWDDRSNQWIMSLYMDRGYEFGFFSSSNLKDWKYLSSFSLDGDAECPGFEALPVDGDKNNKKWLLFGAKGMYRIGSFDGTNFIPETEVLRGDYGKNFYAAMTWSDIPDRCVHIAWMPTRPYPGMPYEQQMNFPTELTLRTTPKGVRAFRMPVKEIQGLYDKEQKWEGRALKAGENLFSELAGDLYDMDLEIDVQKAASFDIGIRGATIRYDASRKLLSCGGPTIHAYNMKEEERAKVDFTNNLGEAPLAPVDGKIKLRILVDRTTVEVFGNDGEIAITSCFMPEKGNQAYRLASEGELGIVRASVHSLKSAWGE